MESSLVEFVALVTATRNALGLTEATPDAVDVTLGVLREFRAFESRKPKGNAAIHPIDSDPTARLKRASATPAPGGEYQEPSIS